MKKELLEYIKVVCLVIIAISLSIIAWKSIDQTFQLKLIEEKLSHIGNRINDISGQLN